MRIAFAKPEHHVVGGFERVLMRLEQELISRGHTVSWLTVDVPSLGPTPFGVGIPMDVFWSHSAYFGYMTLVDAFQKLDARAYDVLISTQPPTFAVRHPRHIALFYHHERVYYDFFENFIASGHADRKLHERARDLVHRVDGRHLSEVTHFLAGSRVVAERLKTFSGLTDNVSVWHVGPAIEAPPPTDLPQRPDDVLCVGRSSLGKRTELFVQAMKYLPEMSGLVVGDGVRLPFVKALDARLSSGDVELDALTAEDLWLNRAELPSSVPQPGRSNVTFLGHASDDEVGRLYGTVLCVVAPPFGEDYGLIAIEAMAYGKPVIACSDGGGLADLVEDGVNGIVVEPTGRAIADAIRRLRQDPDLARAMGERGREMAKRYSWARAIDEFLACLDRVAA